ncbi:peptidoglycan D,D-transpeptidase FtsI family protein [candidate division KSB1 bacterium]
MILVLLGIKYLIFLILAYVIFRLFGGLIAGDRAFSPVFRKRGWSNIKLAPLLVFAVVLLYQVKILYFEKPGLLGKIIEQEDKRKWNRDRYFERGKILDRNGIVLAESNLESEFLRNYPYVEETAHLLGYFLPGSKVRTGIERIFNERLSGEIASGFTLLHPFRFAKNFSSIYIKGDDLDLSIDAVLQKTAYEGLAGRKGAAVGIDPETGDILFLVSSPGFDPHILFEDSAYNNKKIRQKAQLNRAVNGLYEPGSTFKVIVAAAAIEKGQDRFRINCTNEGFVPGGVIRAVTDHGNEFHGDIGLERAIIKSCNVYFAQLGIRLTEEVVKEYAEKFLFNTDISMRGSRDILKPGKSFFPPLGNIDENALAWSSIGQYQLQITPLHMAVIAAIIANDGVFVEPKIEKNIRRGDRDRIIARDTAVSLRKMMQEVVGDPNNDLHGPPTWEARERFGTGWKAKVQGLPIAGKTGTAENPHGEPHAWFMGFAPVENPKIAFAFVVENGGYGGDVSGPIAKQVLQKAVELGYFRDK